MSSTLEGGVVAVIGAGAVWGALQVPPAPAGETWAGLVPMVVAVSLLVFGIWMAFANIRSVATTPEGASETAANRGNFEVIGLFVLSLAYYQGIQMFGYLLPTAVAAPAALFFFGIRRPLALALSAIICPAVFHVLFFELLGVFPPLGEVFDLLDLIRS